MGAGLPWETVVTEGLGVGVDDGDSPPPIGPSVGVGVAVGAVVALGTGLFVGDGVDVVAGVVGVGSVKVKVKSEQDTGPDVDVPEVEQSCVPSTLQLKDPCGTEMVPIVALAPIAKAGTSRVATRLLLIKTLACCAASSRWELLLTLTSPEPSTEKL